MTTMPQDHDVQLATRREISPQVSMTLIVLCVLCLITAVPHVLYAQNGQQQTEAASQGPIHLVATVKIDRTEPDLDKCFETAKGRQDRWRDVGEIFTDVSNLKPSPISIFTLGLGDADHMNIYAPPNVPVDQVQLERLEYAIQVFARPTLKISLVGWLDKDYKHHIGKEFVDLATPYGETTVELRYAHLEGLRFNGETLRNVDFTGANLAGASLCHLSDLTGFLNFTDADLTGANLANSNFSYDVFVRANLTDADLTGAFFDGADLAGAIFEPSQLPSVGTFAHAKNIDQLSYRYSPESLNKMRRQLEDANLHDDARKVTYALNETEDARLLHSCHPPDRMEVHYILLGVSPMRKADRMACVTYYVRKVLFEKTNSYGLRRSKPVLLLLCVWAVGGILFWIVLQWNWRSGLSVRVCRSYSNGSEHIRIFPLKTRYWSSATRRKRRSFVSRILASLKDQTRLAGAAAFYSLTAVTTLGFQEWKPGLWIALMLDRDYTLTGRGWVKRLGGIQALVSFYLLVLMVLTWFNLPFS
jgi:uncharacterized protein YjbI with pentapeptide repeats